MATDLFALFPDLPWPRISPPPPRVWPEQDLPPPPRPRHLLTDRKSAKEAAALREIYEIALRERKRLTPRSAGARALDQIIEIARTAL
jgi:hypothetical protein